MKRYRWLTREMVLALHEETLAQFGGEEGLRDEGLLLSALARPRNLMEYEEPSLAQLAAAYGSGVVRNHAFVDGNKRAGLLCMAVFLRLDGYALQPDQADEVATIMALAAGELSDDQLAAWLANNMIPLPRA